MLQEGQKEEKDYQHRPQFCGLFFSFFIERKDWLRNRIDPMQHEVKMIFSESLKRSKDFQNVYRKGSSQANKYLVMYLWKNDSNRNRLGISVSKKVGNSVVRHRITRLIRESYRLNEEKFQRGYDFVVIARAQAKACEFHEMESALLHMAKIHKVRNDMREMTEE